MTLATARALLADVAEATRAANIADSVRIDAMADFYEDRTCWQERAPGSPDSTYLHNSVVAEISSSLAVTCPVIDSLLQLRWGMRLAVLDAFRAGDLTLAKVRVIASNIAGVPAAVMTLLDADILACAVVFAPGPLAREIERLIRRFIPEWDAEARKIASKKEKRVRFVKMRHGLLKIEAVVDAPDGIEVQSRMEEARNHVCFADPRTPGQLVADSLIAVSRGTIVTCLCTREDCPRRTVDQNSTSPKSTSPKSTHLTQLNIDLETILGLGNAQPYLRGYGPLDSETAAALADDGTWQAIFHASGRFLDTLIGGPASRSSGRCNCNRLRGITSRALDAENAENAESRRDEGSVIVGRSKKLRPGRQPRLIDTDEPEPVIPASRIVEYWQQKFEWEPAGFHVRHPDGRGGFSVAPPGALIYAPGVALAEYVRGRHPTCVHPGCQVASARCDLDHVIEFDKNDPQSGGWTIESNLRPLCRRHHNMKTDRHWDYEILHDGTVHASDPLGNHYFRPVES